MFIEVTRLLEPGEESSKLYMNYFALAYLTSGHSEGECTRRIHVEIVLPFHSRFPFRLFLNAVKIILRNANCWGII